MKANYACGIGPWKVNLLPRAVLTRSANPMAMATPNCARATPGASIRYWRAH